MTSAKLGSSYSDLFAAPNVRVAKDQTGATLLENGQAMPDFDRCSAEWLVRWANERPDQVFIAEKNNQGSWRRVTYSEAFMVVTGLAGWILETSASVDRPIVILSENSVDHALLSLAAFYVGIPVATVSTAYSLLTKDHAKLKSMIELLDPGVVYVSSMQQYGGAVKAIAPLHTGEVLTSDPTDAQGATLFSETDRQEASSAVSAAFHAVTPDTVARLLFTSGSTGTPKAVMNTQRMMTSNQAAHAEVWTFLKDSIPVLVDWLPWSHTFGANFSLNMILRNGGSLYIDDGKPGPGIIDKTIANMKEIRPTMCLNVPRGYEMIADVLEQDDAFREIFFDMDLAMNAAAALPSGTWEHLKKMSRETTGREMPIVCSWGSTETAPLATHCHFETDNIANIGLPIPGVSLKLALNGEKLEVRVKGPNVTPGYYKNPEKTAEAFDDDGYYIMGDAVRFADENDPAKGLFFDGRVSEDFKLTSGTWVSVGELRVAGIDALSPVAQDIVVAGHDRDAIGFLIFPNEAACRKISGLPNDAALSDVLSNDAVRAKLAEGLAKLKAKGGGSSRYAARARFLLAPPNPDTGEITDKAYLNQRQTLANRSDDLGALFGDDSAAYVTPA